MHFPVLLLKLNSPRQGESFCELSQTMRDHAKMDSQMSDSSKWKRDLDCKLCIGSIVYLLGIRDSVLTEHGIRMCEINSCLPCHTLIHTTISMPRGTYPPLRLLGANQSFACQVHSHKERFYEAKRNFFDQLETSKFCDDCQRIIGLAKTNMIVQQLLQELDMNLSE